MASSSQASSKMSRTAENSRIFHLLLYHKGISLTASTEIFNKLVDDDEKLAHSASKTLNREHLDEVSLEDGGSFAWEVANPSLLISRRWGFITKKEYDAEVRVLQRGEKYSQFLRTYWKKQLDQLKNKISAIEGLSRALQCWE